MTVEHIYELWIRRMSTEDQSALLRLVLDGMKEPKESPTTLTWMDLRGIAPNLLNGEDAQEWVTRGRHESDVHRERVLRKTP